MISATELSRYLDLALAGLKDFQHASMEALYEGLYRQHRPCMLLADETGLGKTVVAKGLIAKVIRQRREEGRRKPFKVTYICSNQVLAKENLKKLNIFPDDTALVETSSRIAYLAFDHSTDAVEREQTLLELNTLTPATSFQVSTGLGDRWERIAIYVVLSHDVKMRNRQSGLRWLLKGGIQIMSAFEQKLAEAEVDSPIRDDLPDRYISALNKRRVPASISAIYDELPQRREQPEYSLYEATVLFSEIVDGRNWSRLRHGCWHLARMLRECLVDCCLSYVDADLYILDEFQRFRGLIDEKSEEEQAQIARRIFFKSGKDTRILLLSATPFKAFTGEHDHEQGEDHFKDFGRVLSFLLRSDAGQLTHYEQHRKALYKQLLDLRHGGVRGLSPQHRIEVEAVLRSVICRTERNSVAQDPGALIEDVWKDPAFQIPFGPGDVENFLATDHLAKALAQIGFPIGKPVEYCKSALYPLSFLDHYQFKERLREKQGDPLVASALAKAKNAWLDLKKIDHYRWLPDAGHKLASGPANARLRLLIDRAVGPHGAGLLWVPPSLPYYKLCGGFQGAEGFSKTLVFSTWIMVPRMIATLVSYEVERRTVANPATIRTGQENEKRRYFSKKRHPLRQIRYARRNAEAGGQLANLSNFTLLYPSLTLCRVVEPIFNIQADPPLSLVELIARVAKDLRGQIAHSNLSRWVCPTGESERWYWAAPLLLDLENADANPEVRRWFADGEHWDGDTWFRHSESEDAGLKEEHCDFLEKCSHDPHQASLGPMPEDLPEVLARMALGSPAVVALRSLRRHFYSQPTPHQMVDAFDVADEFCSLYNKPESIAAIRLHSRDDRFWQQAIQYGADGCLQSVLDEYFHLLKGQSVSAEDAVGQLLGAINLNASTVNVDGHDSFRYPNGEPRKMRCHYAVEFGSQRLETANGQHRASSLRQVFNSPFRPFLLATTSIGQEGLDFHSYCRRIVHWNLPGNPVDLEQREGRINRFKSLVIRQQVAGKYRALLGEKSVSSEEDLWEILFQIAAREERKGTQVCDMIPFWHLDSKTGPKIERLIPLYPFSVDHSRLLHMLKTLAIYRLAFGQPRQVELVDHLIKTSLSDAELRQAIEMLMINLSPIHHASSSRT